MSIKELFCCTCGIYKEGQSSGENPTTMCCNCTSEEANYCCGCKTKLSKEQTIVLCSGCLYKLKHRVN